MAQTNRSAASFIISTNSYDTALCVIPPTICSGDIDRLRELYDKAFGKWPAHINLIYPFVAPDKLLQAQQQIKAHFDRNMDLNEPKTITLEETGLFKHRNNSTIFLQERQEPKNSCIQSLRSMALQALGQTPTTSNLHLTIGQSEDNTLSSQQFLVGKSRLIPVINFRIGALAILVRERASDSASTPHMKLWGVIDVARPDDAWRPNTPEPWIHQLPSSISSVDTPGEGDGIDFSLVDDSAFSREVQAGSTFHYDLQQDKWLLYRAIKHNSTGTRSVTISSYNVLIDSEYPPARDRDPLLVQKILSNEAKADILVLQEVSDDFLSYLLEKPEIRNRYPFTSHAPPNQPDIGPLSSLRNIVILSCWHFKWTFVPFHRRHKDKLISNQTVASISSMETAISDVGLVDAWAVAHVEAADEVMTDTPEELFEGENGATFDPKNNILAANTSGTSNGRPQRYDRVLVRSQETLRISKFNHFGLPEDVDGVQVVASDHFGVRAILKVLVDSEEHDALYDHAKRTSVQLIKAPSTLLDPTSLSSALEDHCMIPTADEIQQRQDAFTLLKQIVTNSSSGNDSVTSDIPMVIVSVGSYALGMWTSASDVDCLCIGTTSSKTFFKLARQRLLKAEDQNVRILRKVEASTGTMLELSVNGVSMDLQYCPAAQVVERWSEFRNLPSEDPIFNLSILALRKLKPYRDLLYIQRTLPSLPTFRLAYRCIKLWAVQRGIYSAKFGYLGGVHITLILSWVSKRIAHDFGPVTAADLVMSFFYHFAHFNWANDMMYDSFFHTKLPRYHRSTREPMVILGFHSPNSNIAHTSTIPGLRTLIKEAQAANKRLSDHSLTWEQFFGTSNDARSALGLGSGANDFLMAHGSYVKIDIQFWGRTLAKGKSLVGWVESRCLSLVVDLHKSLADLEVRIWPARFTDNDENNGNDYHGCYLIGLSRDSTTVGSTDHENKTLTKQTLNKVLDRFLTQLRTDEKNYDANTCWIDVTLARKNDVKSLRLDDRDWGDYVAHVEIDSDDEDDVGDLSDELVNIATRTIPQRPKPTATPVSTSKLRPASDILNRLRWDANLDPSDYIIGYEDRFLGAKEINLEKWKTEQTDEEFIPQHRILYFKKRGDEGVGEVMWERATRIDKIFGSGLGAGSASSLGNSG
ncbi:Poly(A) polymerase type 3 [Phaeosphaeriaceae sp. PMI808]|nr:Poly(A) polymerase type 3 [Phaeosphaeriaceae sp. PMI808]